MLLQTELYTARTLYAKAVSVREALEARASRAEAEKAAAETSLQQSQSQVSSCSGVPTSHSSTLLAYILASNTPLNPN